MFKMEKKKTNPSIDVSGVFTFVFVHVNIT